MDDLQQLADNNRQQERFCSFDTNHPTYQDFHIKMQKLGDGDVLITLGTGGCYNWTVLTREDARRLAYNILEVSR
jgi:hypothetical protein